MPKKAKTRLPLEYCMIRADDTASKVKMGWKFLGPVPFIPMAPPEYTDDEMRPKEAAVQK